MPETPSAAEQLYQELHRVVSRYGKESDVTVFETVGALEAVKLDMMDELKRCNERG